MRQQFKRLVFLKRFQNEHCSAFGDEHGVVHWITDWSLHEMQTYAALNFDMDGAIQVSRGISSVHIPVSPVAITPLCEDDSGVRFGQIEIALNRYDGPSGMPVKAGFANVKGRPIWAVEADSLS